MPAMRWRRGAFGKTWQGIAFNSVTTAKDIDLSDPDLETIPPVRPTVGIVGSFRAAVVGVLRTVATQRNMKVHLVSGLMVMIVGMALPLDLSTRVALLFAVAIVFFAEILNTSLEALIDLFVKDFHRLAMLAKDAAAAGVLVLAVTTVIVLAEILRMEWHVVEQNLDAVWRSVTYGVPLVVVELLGLFLIGRGWPQLVRLGVSLALAWPLLGHTKDPLFGLVAVGLLLTSYGARAWFTPTRTA